MLFNLKNWLVWSFLHVIIDHFLTLRAWISFCFLIWCSLFSFEFISVDYLPFLSRIHRGSLQNYYQSGLFMHEKILYSYLLMWTIWWDVQYSWLLSCSSLHFIWIQARAICTRQSKCHIEHPNFSLNINQMHGNQLQLIVPLQSYSNQ